MSSEKSVICLGDDQNMSITFHGSPAGDGAGDGEHRRPREHQAGSYPAVPMLKILTDLLCDRGGRLPVLLAVHVHHARRAVAEHHERRLRAERSPPPRCGRVSQLMWMKTMRPPPCFQ